MANPFLALECRDVDTAIMLEQAVMHDIGKAVAFTDGKRIFINTEDNLFNILPAYDHKMLKWLLWHEKMHLELKHHARFFKFTEEVLAMGDKVKVTHSEVNIIMDILVHDWMCKKFPDLIETAEKNLAQMRDKNSLKYTFKTFTLEEMLKEYSEHKNTDEGDGDKSEEGEDKGTGKGEGVGDEKSEEPKEDKKDEGSTAKGEKGHEEGGSGDTTETKAEDGAPEITDEEEPEPEPEPPARHDETDWSKLDELDSKEFISKDEGEAITKAVERLKKKKFKLAKLTETLNGLVTSTRRRSYAMPSTTHIGHGVLLKGSTPGRTQLYLCFDASGSMGREMETFKDIISKSIPQAMDTPTEWFSGWGNNPKDLNPAGRTPHDYYKAKFKDFMKVHANNGYSDDGDRVIEMCFKAEQLGYSPIGVTDGGGRISWSKDMIKQLKRTVLVGDNKEWLDAVHSINPKVQILDI